VLIERTSQLSSCLLIKNWSRTQRLYVIFGVGLYFLAFAIRQGCHNQKPGES
jgi:hypothetical protein